MARYPKAVWLGSNKHGYRAGNDTHWHQGVVIHSAEGGAAGLLSVLNDPNRQASWHFHVLKSGIVYQPVDTDNIAWTNGSLEANQRFWGIECEGGGPGSPGEPLTEPQYQALLGVVRWLWDTHSLSAFKRQTTLWEHNEMTRFGATATSCPSGRIPWARLIADLEDDMAGFDSEQKDYLRALSRQIVRAIATGRFELELRTGDPNYQQAERDLGDIEKLLNEVKAAQTGATGGGATANQITEAVKQAHREGTG